MRSTLTLVIFISAFGFYASGQTAGKDVDGKKIYIPVAASGDLPPGEAINIPSGVARAVVRDALAKRQLVNIPDSCIACGVPFFETKFPGMTLYEARLVKVTKDGLSFDVDKVSAGKRSTIAVRLVFNTLDFVSVTKATPENSAPAFTIAGGGKQFLKEIGDTFALAWTDLADAQRFTDALNRMIMDAYQAANGLTAEKSRGALGVYLQSVSSANAKVLGLKESRGVILYNVPAASPAEKAGLKRYDVITTLNGVGVGNAMDLRGRLMKTQPEEDVTVDVIRDGRPLQFKVHLGSVIAFADVVNASREKPETAPKPTDVWDKYRILAENAYKENDYISAVRNYELGVAALPTWAEGWFNAALLYAGLEQYDDAADRMRHYLILKPDARDAAAAREKLIVWEDKAKK